MFTRWFHLSSWKMDLILSCHSHLQGTASISWRPRLSSSRNRGSKIVRERTRFLLKKRFKEYCKVQILWEGHKNPHFVLMLLRNFKIWWKIFWPSHNIISLPLYSLLFSLSFFGSFDKSIEFLFVLICLPLFHFTVIEK